MASELLHAATVIQLKRTESLRLIVVAISILSALGVNPGVVLDESLVPDVRSRWRPMTARKEQKRERTTR